MMNGDTQVCMQLCICMWKVVAVRGLCGYECVVGRESFLL